MKSLFILVFIILQPSIFNIAAKENSICERGVEKVKADNFKDAIELLEQCLSLTFTNKGMRAYYLKLRAWSYYSIGEYSAAVDDQTRGLKLSASETYLDFINLGVYLREANLNQQSLSAFYRAIDLEGKVKKPTMMTNYNIGWTLYKLRRYQESIKHLTLGIEFQPTFSFAYLRRGLAYYALNKTEDAQLDLLMFVVNFKNQPMALTKELESEIEVASKEFPFLASIYNN